MARTEKEIQEQAIAEALKAVKAREVLMRTNKVELAGVVLDNKMLPQAMKTDKEGKTILDDNNQPTFFDEKWWCSIGVVGSEEGVLLSAELAQNIHKDSTYMFSGRLKNRKFICDCVTEI